MEAAADEDGGPTHLGEAKLQSGGAARVDRVEVQLEGGC